VVPFFSGHGVENNRAGRKVQPRQFL